MRAAIALLLIAVGARAQFLNRAVWLGVDEEEFRRNFDQGTEYFLDRMSYVIAPPWWDRGLSRFDNEAQYRFGSVTGSEFSIDANLDHQVELGDGASFRYHFLQGETRDARFVRNVVALEYATSASTAVFAQGTPLADKSLIDVSVGAWLLREDDQALRVMLTLVDAPSEKSRILEYDRAPYGLHVAGTFGSPDSHRIAFEIGAQLPFELQRLDNPLRLEMQRYIGTVETQLRLGARDWLSCSLESEHTEKKLLRFDMTAPLLEDFDRTFHQARVEWWRDGPMPWSIGVVHTYLSEDGRRPDSLSSSPRTQRREWLGVARMQLPISDKFSFEPQLLAGNVRNFTSDGILFRNVDRFEGKIAWNARWDFSANVTLALVVTTQLDEMAFGGGGCQFVARF